MIYRQTYVVCTHPRKSFQSNKNSNSLLIIQNSLNMYKDEEFQTNALIYESLRSHLTIFYGHGDGDRVSSQGNFGVC